MSRTTPPRPFDVTALFPQLAPLARTATRLHPRAGSPSRHDSSVGGPLLWPADEPWPYCDGPHEWDGVNEPTSPEDVRVQRRINEAAASGYTPEERAVLERIRAGRPWPEGPVAMLPVAQLYVRDVPLLRPPGRADADLLQVLWCPFDHPTHPRTALYWRSAAEVTDVLGSPPEPPAVQLSDYVPQPCLLSPEEVTEYPHFLELDKESQGRLADWSRWEAAGDAVDSAYSVAPQEFYTNHLSVSPGWKAGGWSRWGVTDPMPRTCSACGTGMDPLLTIASTEWNKGTGSWAPEGDQARDPLPPGVPPANYTRVVVAGGYALQLHVCPVSADHPHLELVQ
ncbi:hypothetical protein OIE75_31385 [Streptomyces sp. NBC_01723]|uniref:hypothetical protein n=1 Tax=unclassified Streptomyces TaxID=2593676 RepID=UPI00277E18FA|nr:MULTISPECIES: hypothetical protein [unclassified Streptomyces]MDQ0407149.1 hypothetical protein [Streptomyces sp. DSM 40167]